VEWRDPLVLDAVGSVLDEDVIRADVLPRHGCRSAGRPAFSAEPA
jgi:hypothetical protein